jgi:exonuclease 3'-5' domain-containing protein 1
MHCEQAWQKVKDKDRNLFNPIQGGSYAVFDQRPLSQDIMIYCVQDVTLMPHLRQVYRAKLCDGWWRKIEAEMEVRIRLSLSVGYNGKGRHMAEGPRG